MAAQPPWQLPTIAGFGLSGCSSRTLRTNACSARADVEQRLARLGLAGRRSRSRPDGRSRSATPTCESSLKPPIPGPWPARGSMIMYGRRFGSTVTPRGRDDPHQRVVDRALERAAVDDHLVVEVQHRRQSRARRARRSCCRAGAACPRTGPSAARRPSGTRTVRDQASNGVSGDVARPAMLSLNAFPTRSLKCSCAILARFWKTCATLVEMS